MIMITLHDFYDAENKKRKNLMKMHTTKLMQMKLRRENNVSVY